jgi:hypothetical protein
MQMNVEKIKLGGDVHRLWCELMSPMKHMVELFLRSTRVGRFENESKLVLDTVRYMLIQLCSTYDHIYFIYECLWSYCITIEQMQYFFIHNFFTSDMHE